MKDAEPVIVPGLQHLAEVGLVVSRRPWPRAVVVETPHSPVGQEPPVEVAVRLALSRREVAQYLAVRRPRPAPAVRVAGVERSAEPLALLDHQSVREPVFRPALPGGTLLRVGVLEQQVVGDVFVASRALLRKVVGPSEQLQHGANQLLLGDCLVRAGRTAQRLVPLPNAVPERLERIAGRDRLPPFGRGAYALGQKVLGKQMARHVNDSPRLWDCRTPASPSRGIVP